MGPLIDRTEQHRPTTSGVIFQKPLPGGTSITIKKQKAVNPTPACPLSVTATATSVSFTRTGTIGGLIPSNLVSGNQLLTLSLNNGWNYVYAQVQSMAGMVQSVTLAKQSTPVEPIGQTQGLPPTSFKIALYAIHVNAGASRVFRFWGCGNISVSAMKTVSYTKSSLSCGEYPFIDVWTWTTTLSA